MPRTGPKSEDGAISTADPEFREIALAVRAERFPIRGAFTISRGSKTEAEVVVAELTARTVEGAIIRGRGECVPYKRYGESIEGVLDALRSTARAVAAGMDRVGLQSVLPAGAARNALDCAFWDLWAKAAGRPAWALTRLNEPQPITTAFTLSLGSPAEMGAAAVQSRDLPLLKLKLGGGVEDVARVAAVRAGAPPARLIVDANEGWSFDQLQAIVPELAKLGVALIEQPLPAGEDGALADYACPIPLGADESCHEGHDLPALRGRYQAVNIKLDKAGGLTEALAMMAMAQELGFLTMVGCMVSTSLAMAPAFLAAQGADFVDLDGPLLLARDREPGLSYTGACIAPPPSALWG